MPIAILALHIRFKKQKGYGRLPPCSAFLSFFSLVCIGWHAALNQEERHGFITRNATADNPRCLARHLFLPRLPDERELQKVGAGCSFGFLMSAAIPQALSKLLWRCPGAACDIALCPFLLLCPSPSALPGILEGPLASRLVGVGGGGKAVDMGR